MSSIVSDEKQYTSLKADSLSVKLIGDAALITGKLDYGVVIGGQSQRYMLLFTEWWIKVEELWQLIHRHACRLSQ